MNTTKPGTLIRGGSRYTETFILVAPDCPVQRGVVPPSRGETRSVAALEYVVLTQHPYTFTHEELILEGHSRRLGLSTQDAQARQAEFRAELFAKPRACMRASPLPKRYGWGVHFDAASRIAIYARESEIYRRFAEDDAGTVSVLVGMRNKRQK